MNTMSRQQMTIAVTFAVSLLLVLIQAKPKNGFFLYPTAIGNNNFQEMTIHNSVADTLLVTDGNLNSSRNKSDALTIYKAEEYQFSKPAESFQDLRSASDNTSAFESHGFKDIAENTMTQGAGTDQLNSGRQKRNYDNDCDRSLRQRAICPWRYEYFTDPSVEPYRVRTIACAASQTEIPNSLIECHQTYTGMFFRLRQCPTESESCFVLRRVKAACLAVYPCVRASV